METFKTKEAITNCTSLRGNGRATSCQNAATKGPNNCSQFFTSSFSADISRQLDIRTLCCTSYMPYPEVIYRLGKYLWHIRCLYESLACISKTRVHGGQELFVKWQELFVKNISGISLSLRILGLTVLSRQGYMAGKNYLSSSKNYSSVFTNPCLTVLSRQGYMAGKNYLLKISLAYLGLYESFAFTVLSRQGYMEGKAYLSSSKNYLLKISLAYLCLYESLDCII